MNRLYTRPFAKYYDMRSDNLLKNVDEEIDFFQFVFANVAGVPVSRILDVGCGTGRHYIPLMQAGYEVTGLDQSQNMLMTLKKKAEAGKVKPRVFRKDMRDIDFAAEFDAIICMNSAFQYLLTDEDILQTLRGFHLALKPGGVAVIDMMNFLSLMGRYKENLFEHYTRDGVVFDRAVRHLVDDVPAIWNHYEFGIIEDNGETITYRELHRFRMLNYNEMRRFLNDAGFTEFRCFGGIFDREGVTTNARRFTFAAVK